MLKLSLLLITALLVGCKNPFSANLEGRLIGSVTGSALTEVNLTEQTEQRIKTCFLSSQVVKLDDEHILISCVKADQSTVLNVKTGDSYPINTPGGIKLYFPEHNKAVYAAHGLYVIGLEKLEGKYQFVGKSKSIHHNVSHDALVKLSKNLLVFNDFKSAKPKILLYSYDFNEEKINRIPIDDCSLANSYAITKKGLFQCGKTTGKEKYFYLTDVSGNEKQRLDERIALQYPGFSPIAYVDELELLLFQAHSDFFASEIWMYSFKKNTFDRVMEAEIPKQPVYIAD